MSGARSGGGVIVESSLGVVIAILFVATAAPARAQSVQVAPTAARDSQALELRLDGNGSVTTPRAVVAIGPDRLHAERALTVAFDLDLADLVAARGGRVPALSFLRLSDTREPARTPVVVVFLEPGQGGWLIGALTRDRAGRLVVAGRAPLPPRSTSSAPVRLEIEWAAGSASDQGPGRLSLSAVQPDSERATLLENDALEDDGGTVDRVELGVLATDRLDGLSGRLRLDEFAVYRPSPSQP